MGMPWLRCYNPEIYWKTGEVKITRCPDECRIKWKTERQTKSGWKKQEEREEKKEKRRPAIEEVKIIERIMEEKKDKEEDLIELRATDEMVPQRFYKYLKVFEKKDSGKIPIKKA